MYLTRMLEMVDDAPAELVCDMLLAESEPHSKIWTELDPQTSVQMESRDSLADVESRSPD